MLNTSDSVTYFLLLLADCCWR